MDDRRVADYFVVANLPEKRSRLNEFSYDGAHLKPTHDQPPVTDITVVFASLGESVPKGYVCIEATPTGFPADLNHGSLRSPEVYLCFRRGRDKPPLVDIGVMFEGKERLMTDSEVVLSTPYSRCANVNNSGARTFLTYRRALETNPCNELVVTDICVILTNKGEMPPHAFCMIPKNLNKGMVGSDVYLCYKKSMNHSDLISFDPGVLMRYPTEDREQLPFPSSVAMFCLPLGATLEVWPRRAQKPRPVFSTFVLTVSDVSVEKVKKVYGSAITFYERFPMDQLKDDERKDLNLDTNEENRTLNTNKCICVLSHWPFFDTFEKYLLFLYRMSITGPHPVPIERYICHLLEDTPFPSPQRPRILVQLSGSERVILSQPEDIPLPRSGASFRKLLTNLGPDNCLLVLLLALTEQKILIHSLRPDVLTAVVEAVSMMIFPFHWQCPYIPLCPLGLSDVLNAPLPFLIGVDSRFFDMYDPPHDVHCVDLDTNTVSLGEDGRKINLSTKILPKRPSRVLRASLQALYQRMQLLARCGLGLEDQASSRDTGIDRDFRLRRKELLLELEIQDAFLRFMSTILRGYRNYLLPITKAPTVGTTDASSLFDLQGFQRSRDKTHHKFFTLAMKTQMFIRFIEERSFVSTLDQSLAFFDECAEKCDQEGETRLLELDDGTQASSERTVFVMPPEPHGLPSGESYEYPEGFQLNPDLFTKRDPMKDNLGVPAKASITPGSPIARRTKQEIKLSQKKAKKYAETPMLWAKCLLNTCFSLWFIHLPSHVMVAPSKSVALWSAYDVLVRMKKARLHPADEVCYRVMMQLCGAYSQPVLAVKVLFEMKRSGVLPNAITYGFYNKAVLEAQWPSHMTNSSQMLWNKLRNVIIGVAHFRRAARRGARRKLSMSDSGGMVDPAADDRVSRCSVESGNSTAPMEADKSKEKTEEPLKHIDFTASDSFRSRVGSIVRSSASSLATVSALPTHPANSSAGLLMTSQLADSAAKPTGVNRGSNRKWRHQSAGAAEFQGQRLRHGSDTSKGPAEKSPPFSVMRSESFANDAQILEKLNKLGPSLEKLDSMEKLDSGPDLTKVGTDKDCRQWNGGLSDAVGHENPDCRQWNGGVDADITRRSSESRSGSQDSSLDQRITDFLLSGNRDKSEDRSSSEVLEEDEEEESDDKVDLMSTPILETGQRSPSIPIKRSPVSPTRVPVTENDPLGALGGAIAEEPTPAEEVKVQMHRSSTMPPRSPKQPRGSDPGVPTVAKAMSQSPSMASSLSSIGSSFKLPFSRYSPARLSLRKADFLKGTQMIENALTSFSPSSFNQKKSELLMEGINSLKSAASSMAKKFDEIKEAISANSTPVKPGQLGAKGYQEDEQPAASSSSLLLASEDTSYKTVDADPIPTMDQMSFPPMAGDYWGSFAESFMYLLDGGSSAGGGSSRRSNTDIYQSSQQMEMSVPNHQRLLVDALYPRGSMTLRDSREPVALEICMTTCTRCHNCQALLYDEEIMAGWLPEDSNLNTRCEFCAKQLVPSLQVWGRDFRGQSLVQVREQQQAMANASSTALLTTMTPAQSLESVRSIHSLPSTLARRTVRSAALSCPAVDSAGLLGSRSSSQSMSSEGAETHAPSGSQSTHGSTVKRVSLEESLMKTSSLPNGVTSPNPDLVMLGLEERKNRPDYTKVEDSGCGTSESTSTGSQKGKEFAEKVSCEDCSFPPTPSPPPADIDLVMVPYLSPVVLCKEMETVLEQEGDPSLTRHQFVDDHPIIYWNMVWFFQRVNLPSHLPGLCLASTTINKGRTHHPSWASADYKNVSVRCLWDNHKMHEEDLKIQSEVGYPMYWLWRQGPSESSLVSALVTDRMMAPKALIQQIISWVQCNDLLEPLKSLLSERRKQVKSKSKCRSSTHSAYRDIFFLALVALGRDNINQIEFDREFRSAYGKLPQKYLHMMHKKDGPPSFTTIFCRHYFKDLEL